MSAAYGSPRLVLNNTLGAVYIGVVVAASLYGASCVQAWYYFSQQTDRWHLKLLVSVVMMIDTIHQALITHCVYSYTVSNWDDPAILGKLVPSLLIEVLFNGLTAFLVQSFLTIRIWRLSNRKSWLTTLVGLLVLGEFGCILAYTAISLQYETFSQLAHLKSLSMTINALAAAGDILIAGTLCALLHFSRTGFYRTDTIINKLIIFSVNTGVLTSLCAIASLVSILAAGQTFIYIAFFLIMGRLYTNSLLATLNGRKSIREAAEAVHSTSEPTSNGKQAIISIKVDTEKEFETDCAGFMEKKSSRLIMSPHPLDEGLGREEV